MWRGVDNGVKCPLHLCALCTKRDHFKPAKLRALCCGCKKGGHLVEECLQFIPQAACSTGGYIVVNRGAQCIVKGHFPLPSLHVEPESAVASVTVSWVPQEGGLLTAPTMLNVACGMNYDCLRARRPGSVESQGTP